MRIRRTFIAGFCTAALASTGGLLFSTAASAQSTAHTLAFTAVKVNTIEYSQTASAETDKDVSSGKLIGFDVLHSNVNPTSNVVTITGAVDVQGGLIYGTLTSTTTSSVATGTVTGGTGAFKDATGTITAEENKSGSKIAVKIVYST